ncbi:DUF4214 domain-containing protein [Sulfitobacter mediterraneus]|uniref:DUF4214 domain-containing protein n=1 Tax=Sulfitobacter TaxID=60136 RepID=UPI001932AC36|nr:MULTISPECIES: DUF4214 domain-containing protein [Sulfitobacter]MBM1631912.1 DUF4214 domain-containing protein [Sulfitobacter mediterraneus]MBM1639727.1 DUF4214 domain-containing protein [Sulfitobacter mediterraneus]MBM1643776.1 DUF4214 domain-containing protein [Sulfitobacter mediterraneus]MBM1647822.1 DUF4214 domain-containing protein [Sulfitobacter mediterraneus]MBM1651867.1 DUF4214 domain-containing protein [Sulfitobacter mediterraneus]
MDIDYEAFTNAFNQSFDSFGTIGAYSGGFSPPGSVDDILGMSVGQYLDLLDAAQTALESISPFIFQQLLNNPNVQLPPEARAFIEAWAQGDYSGITGPLDQVRAAMADFPRDMSLRDAIDNLDPSGGTTDEIEQLFNAAQARAAELLWGQQDGIFNSPIFDIDPATGIWSVFGDPANGYGGSTLGEFYSLLGEAAGNAIMAFIGSNDSVIGELLGQGANNAAFNAATNAAEIATAQAFEALQGIGALLTEQAGGDAEQLQEQAAGQVQALIDALVNALPGISASLNTLILGSRNSDPSFVVSLDGNVEGSEHGDWFYLSKNADSFDGGLGTDVLFGMEGNDTLTGGADEDVLFGGADDDHLTGGAANDGINGGDGEDTAGFSGAMGRYTLQMSADGGIVIEDRQADGDGTDTLTGIETLSFSSGWSIFDQGSFDLSIVQGITGLDQAQIDTFIELYIAYFNRAPDALGLYFWGSAFANGTSLDEMAALFLDQDETRATYPEDATNLDFATQVYSNVLGRTPDQAGLDFWVGQLDQGNVTRGTFILRVLEGAKSDPPVDATQDFIDLQRGDQAFLLDKTDIGTYFAVIKGMSDTADASAAMALYLRDDTASKQAAVDRVDVDFAEAMAADSGEMLLQLVGVAENPFEADGGL